MDITFFSPKEAPTSFFRLSAASYTAQLSYDHQEAIDMQSSNNHQQPQNSHTSTSQSSDFSAGGGGGDLHHSPQPVVAGDGVSNNRWASTLLKECARAISNKDSNKINHFLWMLNELGSPYGDCDQKLASYFLQALFCKATETGMSCYKTLISVAEKNQCFDSARKLILKFQETSPWTTFGHVASNGVILEALEGETKLHIIDISNTLCTQWPTLLESLATRNDETPHLKLTVVITSTIVKSVMKEIGQRMEKFARLMGVPFEFNVITEINHLGELVRFSTKEGSNSSKVLFNIEEDEAIAINCIGALRRVKLGDRKTFIEFLKSLKPKVLTVVEEEADFVSSRSDFVKLFEECLKFYTLYFDMLEESFVPTSNERLFLERECSRSIVKLLGCDHDHYNDDDDGLLVESERRERGKQWSERLKEANFSSNGFSDDVLDDVKALLKRYKSGWELSHSQSKKEADGSDQHDSTGIYLTWKEEPVVWVSAWKP